MIDDDAGPDEPLRAAIASLLRASDGCSLRARPAGTGEDIILLDEAGIPELPPSPTHRRFGLLVEAHGLVAHSEPGVSTIRISRRDGVPAAEAPPPAWDDEGDRGGESL